LNQHLLDFGWRKPDVVQDQSMTLGYLEVTMSPIHAKRNITIGLLIAGSALLTITGCEGGGTDKSADQTQNTSATQSTSATDKAAGTDSSDAESVTESQPTEAHAETATTSETATETSEPQAEPAPEPAEAADTPAESSETESPTDKAIEVKDGTTEEELSADIREKIRMLKELAKQAENQPAEEATGDATDDKAAESAQGAAAQESTTLTEQLEALASSSEKNLPEEMKTVMNAGLEELIESGIVDKAVAVDDQAPVFELPNYDGETITLAGLIEEGPLVLIFFRGGWCPYCNAELAAYQKHLAMFEAAGAKLVAITPELPEHAAKTAKRHKLGFPVLSDVGNKVADEYRVAFTLSEDLAKLYDQFLDMSKYNGDKSYKLPLPATYVIDREGKIRYAFLDEDYRKRAEPSDVLEAVKQLSN
jgi:peroxiredoxin